MKNVWKRVRAGYYENGCGYDCIEFITTSYGDSGWFWVIDDNRCDFSFKTLKEAKLNYDINRAFEDMTDEQKADYLAGVK